jgi:transcriptional regulator with XRE-family HTH domain
MNRIQYLRDKAGLTQGQLAAKMREINPGCKVTQTNISRWENGERFPRGENLVMLAEALGVQPADLIESVLAVDLRDEFEPVVTVVSSALIKLGAKAYRVTADSVERAGIKNGDIVLLISTPEAVNTLIPGDFVAVEAENEDGNHVRILRQFLPPDLLTTNRNGTNLSVRISDTPHALRIVAKVIPQ